jgi:hypothetical protein
VTGRDKAKESEREGKSTTKKREKYQLECGFKNALLLIVAFGAVWIW